jgi:cellulose synthase/poly-beta-1,6-N-acetylglucosamine synthase-like glycosyltransferase/peptidoglycan/xylan/chitin deacetylase (PgdA/CDA1 family)
MAGGRGPASAPERAARLRRRIRRPPGHWAILAFVLGVLVLLLLVQGVSVHAIGASRTPRAVPGAAPLAGAGPILQERGGRLVSRGTLPPRQVALTFDDGPDPRWTPRIASLLRRLHVPATFFVVGSQAVRRPDLVRRLKRDGFELGNHTFTHADLASGPGWQRTLEVSMTESALAGIAGVRSRLVRPPYSSTPDAVTPRQERALADVAARGYLIVLSTQDGRDWARPGVGAIVRSATPRGGRGAVVLLHDGGGDRAQTLAALRRLVPALRARGYRFVSVSRLAGLRAGQAQPPATGSQDVRGRLLVATLAVARTVTDGLTSLLVAIALLAVARAVLLLALARRHARAVRAQSPDVSYAPPVSIVVPAYDEAVGIQRSVRSLAGGHYPGQREVIVVDDGSRDGTAELVELLGLDGVRVIRQANAGKAAALSRGIAAARHDVLVTVDADTIFEGDTLLELVQPLADPAVGAVAGNTKVGNRRGLLGRWQHIEYVMGFNLDRRLYDVLRCMPTVPGAIGAFRREAVVEAGGVSAATLAEDTDLTLAIGRAGWRVVYAERARAWTEAPASVGALWRQRYRWSYGTLQAVWKHRAAVWRPGEGHIGRRGLPYLVLFQVALPLLAPLIDLFAVYGLLFLDPAPVLAYWLGFTGLQLLLAAYAFRLDGERLRDLWAMPLQQFVYRQLMYLVVIESVISALLGTRLRWQHLDRTGDVRVPA